MIQPVCLSVSIVAPTGKQNRARVNQRNTLRIGHNKDSNKNTPGTRRVASFAGLPFSVLCHGRIRKKKNTGEIGGEKKRKKEATKKKEGLPR